MRKLHEELTQTDIKFWLPIIITIVSVTVWGMTLSNKIDVTIALQKEQKEQQVSHSNKMDRLAQAMNDFSTRLIGLELLHNVK